MKHSDIYKATYNSLTRGEQGAGSVFSVAWKINKGSEYAAFATTTGYGADNNGVVINLALKHPEYFNTTPQKAYYVGGLIGIFPRNHPAIQGLKLQV